MFKIIRISFFLCLIVAAFASLTVHAATNTVDVLSVDGTIVPVVGDYIDRGISEAEDNNAEVCIIELNTPGGLLGTTEEIVQRILNAHVPVVVYVSPKGGWAASAGTFITLSAHVAAMTPGTTIGAAHPVSAGGEQISEDEMKKVVEFSSKWIQTIAEDRNRNAEEAQLAVTESKSFTDNDALNAGLIDLQSVSLDDLIARLNGEKVTLASGAEVTIDTSSYVINRNGMSFVERFLHTISDPNIAYILMSVGSIGIIAEIYNPGALFPGIIGAISLLMAFYSLGVLDANLGGILLMLLALGMFIAEFFTPTFGLLTAGGVTALVFGSLLLFPGRAPIFQVNPWLIAGITLVFVAFFLFVIQRIIKAHRVQAMTGWEELIGKPARVMMALNPEGQVLFRGEHWKAISEEGDIEPGEEVIINRINNLKLYVTKKNGASE